MSAIQKVLIFALAAVSASAANTTTTKASTTASGATAQKVSGSLALTLGTKTECDDLGTTKGKTALQTMLRDTSGLGKTFDLKKIDVTVTCKANRRRLSVEGRRLSTYTGTVGYAITVPAGSTVKASSVADSLNAVTASSWISKVKSAATAQGLTVNPTAVAITKAGVTNVNDASFAKSTCLMV